MVSGVSTKVLVTALCALFTCSLGSRAQQTPAKPDAADRRGGQSLWLVAPSGKLKAEGFSSRQSSAHPVLLVVLHGDLPDPTPSYQSRSHS